MLQNPFSFRYLQMKGWGKCSFEITIQTRTPRLFEIRRPRLVSQEAEASAAERNSDPEMGPVTSLVPREQIRLDGISCRGGCK